MTLHLSPAERRQRHNASAKASRERARDAIAAGTYTGAHGVSCYKLGCPCPKAAEARIAINARERARKAAKRGAKQPTAPRVETSDITVLHWPPRGHGFWRCPDCGETFLHRPPLEDQQQSA